MVTLKLRPGQATAHRVAEVLGLSDADLDQDFGVVNIDPEQHLYTVLVDEALAGGLQRRKGVVGVYANPRIEPFGPPE